MNAQGSCVVARIDGVGVETVARSRNGVIQCNGIDASRCALRGLDSSVRFEERRSGRKPQVDVKFALRKLRN